MRVDGFSELSGERFKSFDESQQGHNVLFFRYFNYDNDLPSPLAGLWLSDELGKRQLEAAHYIPDMACQRALRESGATSQPAGLIWLGLYVKYRHVNSEPVADITMPRFMVEDYSSLAIDLQTKPLVRELEDRFNVAITIAD